ncbi:hypothetical protein OPV22_029973 [Ensete ventricosum]|uniref:Uncharacterized protein n=1 Tax=Ensete ventricosum TaxID=4639 RepID=A0AAV8QCT1_ENSVE|nr:hypothetical protein OPV22_029973 [Ensete ventricosum]
MYWKQLIILEQPIRGKDGEVADGLHHLRRHDFSWLKDPSIWSTPSFGMFSLAVTIGSGNDRIDWEPSEGQKRNHSRVYLPSLLRLPIGAEADAEARVGKAAPWSPVGRETVAGSLRPFNLYLGASGEICGDGSLTNRDKLHHETVKEKKVIFVLNMELA